MRLVMTTCSPAAILIPAAYAPRSNSTRACSAFVGKRAAQEFFGRLDLDYGQQPRPSGRRSLLCCVYIRCGTRWWNPAYWHTLAEFVREMS